uniref:ATP synthase subunit O, mitochondrial n=1 Tax=Hucho hucho TaxID=62062 RepID=A0A4W5RIZ1_9TELE
QIARILSLKCRMLTESVIHFSLAVTGSYIEKKYKIKDLKLSGKRSIKQHTSTDVLTKTGMSPIIINLITFSKMMSAHCGEVICTVTTAQSGSDAANLKDLRVALNGFLAKGETLKLETKSDPSILGGMTVSIREQYVDMFTKTKIQKRTKIIRET